MVTQSDDPNTGVVTTIVVVGAFSMISISALLTTLVRSEEVEMDAVRPVHADLETVAALDQQQLAALHASPHWVDKAAHKVGIPIERAMQLVVADLRKDPGAASPPVPPGLVLPPAPPLEGAAPVTPAPAPALHTVPGTPAAVNPATPAPPAAAPPSAAPPAAAPPPAAPAPGSGTR